MIEDWPILMDLLTEGGLKLGMALVCGFLLGMERETKGKPAGLRTLMLITVGATLFMMVSDLIARVTEGPSNVTRVDPSRIASQVVSGIGFLGAGAIIQARGSVRGITTAATIWVSAGIGLCIGVGFPLAGLAITLLVLVVLIVLDPVRAWLSRRGDRHSVRLIVRDDMLTVQLVEQTLVENDIPHAQFKFSEGPEDSICVDVSYTARSAGKHHLLNALVAIDGVSGARIDRSKIRGG